LFVQSCGENAVPQELGCGWQQFGEAGKRQSLYLQLVSQSKSPTTFFFMVLHHMMVGRDLREGEKEGKGGHQEKTFVGRPFESSRFGSVVDTRYLQATWVWGA
jgi:hypothetical protein